MSPQRITYPTPEDWIRGITIRQPWAACILHGDNRTANRLRYWSWRGWVLLHTGRIVDRTALRDPLVAGTVRGHALETGAVIGVARLIDCHLDDGPCTPWAAPGQFHLVLTDVTPLPRPIPANGALGPWKPLPHVLDQVLRQLPHVAPQALNDVRRQHGRAGR